MDSARSHKNRRTTPSAGSRWSRATLLASVTGAALLLVACAAPWSVTTANTSADIACADDSPRCLAARSRGLTALRADEQRSWLKETPGAREYAAGVRLFALKREKAGLSCAELGTGVREAKRSAEVLRGPQGRGLSPGQISRGILLADEVGRELERERRRRCS